MLKSLGAWIGAAREEEDDEEGLIYKLASSASQKVSQTVAYTAQSLKRSVEEGNINGIIDKTILGDFQKEQQKFVQEKKAKQSSCAVPPWVGYHEEETIQQQILTLSADKRNFMRDPPAGVQFHFDVEQMYPVAMAMLEEDELLRKMRFHLVPKQVKEEAFWRNYFYRVSLIKQSAQLTALAAQHAVEERSATATGEDPPQKDGEGEDKVKLKTAPKEDKEELSSSPSAVEFASDAFGSCQLNEDDLLREMEQLVLDKKKDGLSPPPPPREEMADWEKELQDELQEYEVLADGENRDDGWDQEIEEMLKQEGESG
ncbi:unnamed protein product [Ophioblennius macclurei]